jgi:hypothetical protein
VNESKLSKPISIVREGLTAQRIGTAALAEQQAIALERSRYREARLELVDERETFPEPRHEIVGLHDPVIGAALRADLRHAGGEPAVFCGKRIGQDLDRLHRAAGQLQIEVSCRGIVQAGAADLKRAGRWRTPFDPQSALRIAHDAREHRQERLKVIAGQWLDVHLRAGEHVAHGDRLHALGRRVGGHDDVHALADEGQSHFDQDPFCFAALDGERGGLAVGEAISEGPDDVSADRHVGERKLAHPSLVVCATTTFLSTLRSATVHCRNADAFQRKCHRHTSGTGSWRLCGWRCGLRLRCSRSSGARDELSGGPVDAAPAAEMLTTRSAIRDAMVRTNAERGTV